MVRTIVGSIASLLAMSWLVASPSFAQDKLVNEKAPTAEEERALLLESVGLFSGLQLYNAYLNIGLLADALADARYESTDIAQLLGSVTGPLTRVEKQFERLSKLNLTKEEVEALARLRAIGSLLRQQGKELESYWETGKAEHHRNYQNARKEAWKELSILLQLEAPEKVKDEKIPNPRVVPPMKK